MSAADTRISTPHWRQPLAYTADCEVGEDDEARTQRELVDTLLQISDTTFKDGHGGLRSVHAKSHGLLSGQLQVLDLPAPYAQGLFAQPLTLPVKIRLSTTPGDVLSDCVSTPRGFALKVIGVTGARLSGPDGQPSAGTTQDFLLVDGPAFAAPTVKKFLSSLKLLAPTTDKVPRLKQALSAVLRGGEQMVEALGGHSGTLVGLGGHPLTNILGETFYSQVPFLYGQHIAKWSVVPVSPGLLALTNQPVDMADQPDALRRAVVAHFASQGGEWALRVQLCTGLQDMPVEDASVVWSEDESPFITVARISVPPQLAWSEALATEFDDGMAFNPWHGLVAHRPLGSINRARQSAYAASSQARSPRGRCPIHEP